MDGLPRPEEVYMHTAKNFLVGDTEQPANQMV